MNIDLALAIMVISALAFLAFVLITNCRDSARIKRIAEEMAELRAQRLRNTQERRAADKLPEGAPIPWAPPTDHLDLGKLLVSEPGNGLYPCAFYDGNGNLIDQAGSLVPPQKLVNKYSLYCEGTAPEGNES